MQNYIIAQSSSQGQVMLDPHWKPVQRIWAMNAYRRSDRPPEHDHKARNGSQIIVLLLLSLLLLLSSYGLYISLSM